MQMLGTSLGIGDAEAPALQALGGPGREREVFSAERGDHGSQRNLIKAGRQEKRSGASSEKAYCGINDEFRQQATEGGDA